MTISELAKEFTVSPQAVYQRMKRNGIKLEDIQRPESNALTEEGEQIIRDLFTGQSTNSTELLLKRADEIIKLKDKLNTAIEERDAANREIEAYKQTIDTLEETAEKRSKEIALLTDQLKTVTEDRDFLRLTLANEQQNHRQAMAMLQPARQESGLFARIKARFAKKGE